MARRLVGVITFLAVFKVVIIDFRVPLVSGSSDIKGNQVVVTLINLPVRLKKGLKVARCKIKVLSILVAPCSCRVAEPAIIYKLVSPYLRIIGQFLIKLKGLNLMPSSKIILLFKLLPDQLLSIIKRLRKIPHVLLPFSCTLNILSVHFRCIII